MAAPSPATASAIVSAPTGRRASRSRLRRWVRRVKQDHGSRVSSRSSSHVIVGRKGDRRMASKHDFRLMRPVCSGFSSRTSTKRPSSCCWMSKTSPGRPFGRTMRFLESTLEVLMVGLSHQLAAPVKGSCDAALGCLDGPGPRSRSTGFLLRRSDRESNPPGRPTTCGEASNDCRGAETPRERGRLPAHEITRFRFLAAV